MCVRLSTALARWRCRRPRPECTAHRYARRIGCNEMVQNAMSNGTMNEWTSVERFAYLWNCLRRSLDKPQENVNERICNWGMAKSRSIARACVCVSVHRPNGEKRRWMDGMDWLQRLCQRWKTRRSWNQWQRNEWIQWMKIQYLNAWHATHSVVCTVHLFHRHSSRSANVMCGCGRYCIYM